MRVFIIFASFVQIFVTVIDAKKKGPNIVMIIADDLGWNDVGFHGSNQIPTPNIDALGYNGIIFNRHYTQQSCTPTRAALLTGQYPIRTGMQGLPIQAGEPRSLPLDVPTLPEVLGKLGYSTHLVGKWHLGHANKDVTPIGRGYHSHFGYWNGYVGYFDYEIAQAVDWEGFDLHDNFRPVWEAKGRYATDLFTYRAMEIIENHDVDDPLFMVVSHLAPHTGKNGTELEVPNERESDMKYRYIKETKRRRLADIVHRLDRSVGKIVESLSRKDMLNDTLVIFFSDNGAQTQGFYENFGSNYPLRGLKITLLEGGVRNVAVAWSSRFKKTSIVNNKFFHVSDWLPTLYEAAGGNVEDLGTMDGVSQWRNLVRGAPSERTEMLLNIDEATQTEAIIGGRKMRYKLVKGAFGNGIYDGYYGETGRGRSNPPYNVRDVVKSPVHRSISATIRNGNHPHRRHRQLTEDDIYMLREESELKDCRSEDQEAVSCASMCLFDLFEDPCETKNLVDQMPDVVDELSARLDYFRSVLVPQTNTNADPKSNPKYYNGAWVTWKDYKYRKMYDNYCTNNTCSSN